MPLHLFVPEESFGDLTSLPNALLRIWITGYGIPVLQLRKCLEFDTFQVFELPNPGMVDAVVVLAVPEHICNHVGPGRNGVVPESFQETVKNHQ